MHSQQTEGVKVAFFWLMVTLAPVVFFFLWRENSSEMAPPTISFALLMPSILKIVAGWNCVLNCLLNNCWIASQINKVLWMLSLSNWMLSWTQHHKPCSLYVALLPKMQSRPKKHVTEWHDDTGTEWFWNNSGLQGSFFYYM